MGVFESTTQCFLEFFESINEHVSRKYDVQSSEPDILTFVLLHSLLRVCI